MLVRQPLPDAALERLIDSAFGIVQAVRDTRVQPDFPDLFIASAQTANTAPYFGRRCSDQSSGAGFSRRDARVAAVGESIERYCSGCWSAEDLVFGSYQDLRGEHELLSPSALRLYDPSQKAALLRFAPFTETTPLAWAQAYSMVRKRPVLLPACIVFLPYSPAFAEQGERAICPGYSTGMASGATAWDALYYGLCESIERDAFVNFWLNRLSLPQIDIRSDAELAELFDQRFRRDHLRYTLLDATTDLGVPSVFCLLVDTSYDPPLVCVGGAARLSSRVAVRKALVEAVHTYGWAASLRAEGKRRYRSDFSDVADFSDHVRIHASGALLSSIDFASRSDRRRDIAEMPEGEPDRYEEAAGLLIERLAQHDQEVLAMDLTTADIADVGLRAVRAFVPGLLQLNASHVLRNLGNPRLYELPVRMGLASRPTTLAEINPFPHPFP